MRTIIPERLEAGRIREGSYGTTASDGLMGAFEIAGPLGRTLRIISSGSDSEWQWEHVSVSMKGRTPTWIEMAFVKDLFWSDDECVMQLHPPKANYVNCHPHCLHLWKPLRGEIPQPPAILVGPMVDTPA